MIRIPGRDQDETSGAEVQATDQAGIGNAIPSRIEMADSIVKASAKPVKSIPSSKLSE
jgi:hypothetical protein